MKKIVKNNRINRTAKLVIAILVTCTLGVKAQTSNGTTGDQKAPAVSTPPTTYMMPDGSFIAKEKLDSVRKAWNGAMFIGHTEADKAKGILHVVKLNDDNLKDIAEKNAKDAAIVKSLIGKPAAGFELTDMKGKIWSLAALRGKVVVLNFWYTACPPCLEEMPALNAVVKSYTPDKVVFLALTFDDRQKVDVFLKQHEFNYTIIPSSKTTDQKYKISGWPTSLVINKQGIVTFGSNIEDDIKQALVSAINADL